jgi:hypothetical protein
VSAKDLPIHVFIDNSNLFGGAQTTAGKLEAHVPWQAVRVYMRNLIDLIEAGRSAKSRVLAGSVPPGNDELWKYASDKGYNTDLLRRIEADDGRMKEQGVDEMLHLKIANAILDHDSGHRLVLVTGDGKMSSFGTSFPAQAERALKKGWKIEVWSWKGSLSNNWKRLLKSHKSEISLHELDQFYFAVTFVKSGSFVQANGSVVYVADRVVSKLPTGLVVKRV